MQKRRLPPVKTGDLVMRNAYNPGRQDLDAYDYDEDLERCQRSAEHLMVCLTDLCGDHGLQVSTRKLTIENCHKIIQTLVFLRRKLREKAVDGYYFADAKPKGP